MTAGVLTAEDRALARAARQTRNSCLYLGASVEENNAEQWGAEWRMSEAYMLEDENAALSVQARGYDELRETLMRERVANDDLRRELAAATARIAELSTAVRFAEPAPVERAGCDLATAHAITAHDPTFWFRRCTLLERERAELCAQVARLEAAHGSQPAAPAEPPAPDKVTRHLLDLKVSEMAPLEALTKLMELKRMALEAAPDDDEPTLASLGDRKAQQGRTVDVPPLKRKPVNDLPDVA